MHTGHARRTAPQPGAGLAPLWRVILLAIAFATPGAAVHAATQSPDPPTDGVEVGLADEKHEIPAILASATDEDARRSAAREALRRFGTEASLKLPPAWLGEEPAASLRLVASVAENQAEAETLAATLVRTLRTGENGETTWAFQSVSADARSACLAALARSLEPASCEALVAWLDASPSEQRRPIVQALVSMTGREDLGASHASWRQWLDRHQHLPPLAWRTLLAEGTQRRADRLAQRERDLLARLAESTRRLYSALPLAERPAVLASLLADAEPVVRLTATDLLSRDLERGVNPPAEVASALVGLLDDPQANIRQAAAVLVDRIVPDGSAARLTTALRRETEPEVAAVMLRAFRRSPDAAAIDAVMRWLEHGPATRDAAMRAVVSLLDSGFEPTNTQRERVLAVIDATTPQAMSPASVQVLLRLGGPAGLERVRTLLYAPRAEIRRAAADAVLTWPGAVDDLLSAAEDDPALLQRAADAVAMHKPWASLLRRVALIELATPTRADSVQMLPVTLSLAELMPMHERLAAAQELSRRPFAVRAILGTPSRGAFGPGPAGDTAYARARSLLGLAEPETPTASGNKDAAGGAGEPAPPVIEPTSEPNGEPEPPPTDPGG